MPKVDAVHAQRRVLVRRLLVVFFLYFIWLLQNPAFGYAQIRELTGVFVEKAKQVSDHMYTLFLCTPDVSINAAQGRLE